MEDQPRSSEFQQWRESPIQQPTGVSQSHHRQLPQSQPQFQSTAAQLAGPPVQQYGTQPQPVATGAQPQPDPVQQPAQFQASPGQFAEAPQQRLQQPAQGQPGTRPAVEAPPSQLSYLPGQVGDVPVQSHQQAGPSQPEQPAESWQSQAASPAVDMMNTPDEVSLFVDLPGCDQDDIRVHASDDQLRIVAKRRPEADEEMIVQRERPASIERTVKLPSRTDSDEAKATYEDGVLKITLPKREEDQEKLIGIQ